MVKDTIKTELIDPIKEKLEGLIRKIKQLGENIGEVIKGGIVTPFMTLFEAIGHMFVMTGNIAMKVIDKIKTLPNCSILYIFQSLFATINAIYKYFIPGFLESIFSTIYAYTLKIPLEYMSRLVGLDKWWDKCLSFNVDDEVNSIRDKFNEVGPAFKDSFGKMNFKDLVDFSK